MQVIKILQTKKKKAKKRGAGILIIIVHNSRVMVMIILFEDVRQRRLNPCLVGPMVLCFRSVLTSAGSTTKRFPWKIWWRFKPECQAPSPKPQAPFATCG
ncbi:hypothetical protein BDV26DRAFT_175709 [Aspergillus bertholletiae]|uniref:Uncharacterized protein n=1 Tax=Aspergillus bertholletiae TaxID=1226010 RepID=A0A5N7BBL2_9EURO|nr:hypothetical protein BDV26DRAFT_175709 [Aspergillus bertholletiae]